MFNHKLNQKLKSIVNNYLHRSDIKTKKVVECLQIPYLKNLTSKIPRMLVVSSPINNDHISNIKQDRNSISIGFSKELGTKLW